MPGTGARGVDDLDFMSRTDVSLKNGSNAGRGLECTVKASART